MKKKILAAALAATMMAGIFAGCNGSTPSGTSNPSGSGEKGKEQVIKVWGFGEEGKLLPQMTEKFEALNEGYKVEVQAIPWDSASEKLLSAIAAKSGPDVIQLPVTFMAQFTAAGALADFGEFLDDYPNLALENFNPVLAKASVFNDVQYAVPWQVDSTVLYYRTDVFEEAGLEPPTTWDEMKEVAKQLAARGEGKYGIGLDPTGVSVPLLMAWQNGGDLLNADSTEALCGSEEFKEAVRYWQSFYREGLSPCGDYDILQGFVSGDVPMVYQEPWVTGQLNNIPELEGKWSTALVPRGPVNGQSYIGGNNLTIFQFAENKEGAAKFISFMSEPQVQLEWNGISGTFPSTVEGLADPIMTDDPIKQVFAEQMKEGNVCPNSPQLDAILMEFGKALERMSVGDEEVEPVCDELAQTINKMVKG